LNDEIIVTLEAARDSGWHNNAALGGDERFAFLKEHQRFERLLAGSPRGSATNESPTDKDAHNETRTKN
jgi:hypothetical protein